MAQAIDFNLPDRDAKEPLRQQLRSAPEAHVEALLNAYAILQLLQDKGILELVKGALGSGEKVLAVMTETMESDAVIRTMRNLVVFLKIIGSIEPEVLEGVLKAFSQQKEKAKGQKPPGLFHLLAKLSNPDSRRVLAPMAAAVESLGQQLKKPQRKPGARRRVTRHEA